MVGGNAKFSHFVEAAAPLYLYSYLYLGRFSDGRLLLRAPEHLHLDLAHLADFGVRQ